MSSSVHSAGDVLVLALSPAAVAALAPVVRRAHDRAVFEGDPPHPEMVSFLDAAQELGELCETRRRGADLGTQAGLDAPSGVRWLSSGQVAVRLRVGETMARRLCRRGTFPGATRVGHSWMVPETEVAAEAARRDGR